MNKKKTSPGQPSTLTSLSISTPHGTPSRHEPAGGLSAWRIPGPDADAPDLIAQLRGIRWAAGQVVGRNLDAGKLGREALAALKDSLVRQAEQAQALQRRVATLGDAEDLQDEVAGLCRFLNAAMAEASRQLAPAH